ncbi:hypothetical protein J2S40_000105 [Nocardioides luteus]|uniref:Uncharacterized protein n=1 Tax=Nocardioides luteus TaxID=1844 RepID=A0ABQ5STH6_9ACTN|nr:hypothetical protein [Nocardioides luteus]MDR7309047.1 hypothetical protein [Nocardioides luteus]GGR50139.1 hypothetical protein GCM10010197_15250 [Nocardioides luteus]GLJ67452.1 hypothetical protein GCM10017579_14880 [Nocardioides luteus]
MKLEKNEGTLLLVIGVWTIAIWTNFGRNLVKTAKDPEQNRPRPYYIAHAVLVAVDVVLGGLLVKLGVRALRGRG